jgi:hypothetical protein
VTGARPTGLANRRKIRLGPDLEIHDEWIRSKAGWTRVQTPRPFNSIHMASRGYWQTQDDALIQDTQRDSAV